MSREAMKLALEALVYIHEGANNQGPHTGISWRCVAVKAEPAITAIKQTRALDKKAENARELGLDYEPEERYTYGTPLLDAFTKPSPVQEPDHGDELTIAYMSGVHRGKELARADEREACAKVCEDNATDLSEGDWDSACNNCADHIRDRGNT